MEQSIVSFSLKQNKMQRTVFKSSGYQKQTTKKVPDASSFVFLVGEDKPKCLLIFLCYSTLAVPLSP